MHTTEHNPHFDADLDEYQDVVMQYAYDIKGQLLEVTDPQDRQVFAHKYDTAGNNLWTLHLDSGEKTLAVDAQGKPLFSMDAKGAEVYTAYDTLHRPTDIWAKDASGEDVTLRQHMIYGDSAGLTDPQDENLNGKLYQHYDEAGKATITGYDFKGNPLEKTRRVIADSELTSTTKYVVDWTGLTLALETTEYVTGLLYDGLNRVRKSIYPEDVESVRKELVPTYNRAGALQTITFDGNDHVRHIAYNAKGQRVLLAMGNDMMTRYAYDEVNFRLLRIKTEKYVEASNTYTPQSGTTRQDSGYAYDLGGNILKITERITDCGISGTTLGADALDRTFAYDPLKRLLQATGRESDTQSNSNFWEEKPVPGSPNANHTRAYTQTFDYDKVGNILKLGHQATGNAYNRFYRYTSGQNLLEQLDDDGSPATAYASFAYDLNGNQITINTDRFFEWDAADQLRYFKIDAGTTVSVQAHYLYAGGDRMKKLVRDQQGNVEVTVYIDGVYEHRYRKDSGGTITDEQTQLHVMDGRSRIATVRLGDDFGDTTPATVYNLEDHLGTSTMRLTDTGTVVDREEYYPFGESSLRTFDKKRYRYVGKELDSESGLYYYGARYYTAWVGRFISIDPLAPKYPQLTPYNYAANDPIGDLDIDGMQNTKTEGGGGSNMPPPNTDAELNSGLGKPAFTNDLDPEGLRREKSNPTVTHTTPTQPADAVKAPNSDVQDFLRTHPGAGLLQQPQQPQQNLYATPKSAATFIKGGLNGMMANGGASAAVGLIGMAIYGTAEDAWIFAQGWGTGRPKDFEGWDVGYERRVNAGVMTATWAMGPLMKGAGTLKSLGAAEESLEGGTRLLPKAATSTPKLLPQFTKSTVEDVVASAARGRNPQITEGARAIIDPAGMC